MSKRNIDICGVQKHCWLDGFIPNQTRFLPDKIQKSAKINFKYQSCTLFQASSTPSTYTSNLCFFKGKHFSVKNIEVLHGDGRVVVQRLGENFCFFTFLIFTNKITNKKFVLLKKLQEKYISVKRPLYCAFVDLEISFDGISKEVL